MQQQQTLKLTLAHPSERVSRHQQKHLQQYQQPGLHPPRQEQEQHLLQATASGKCHPSPSHTQQQALQELLLAAAEVQLVAVVLAVAGAVAEPARAPTAATLTTAASVRALVR
jgi:hypothetical protein